MGKIRKHARSELSFPSEIPEYKRTFANTFRNMIVKNKKSQPQRLRFLYFLFIVQMRRLCSHGHFWDCKSKHYFFSRQII